MKKNSGFTIVELVAVIVVLSALMAFTIPVITSSSQSSKQKTYETKIDMIKNGGVMYGQDNYRSISTTGTKTVKAYELIGEYVTADDDSAPVGKRIVDPRNSNEYLDYCQVKITVNRNTHTVTAEVLLDEETKDCIK